MVTIREGKAGEGISYIVAEGDIDVGRRLTREGEDHVPSGCRCAYSDNSLQSRALDSWAVAAIAVRARKHRRGRLSPKSSCSLSSRR